MLDIINRVYNSLYPTEVPKAPSPIRFGILGAAMIAPLALVTPAKTHPEVVLKGIAARDRKRAEEFAKSYGVERVYDTYDEMLKDPEIDVIYNPLPNMLHYEWTMKALAAGKHVLCEKPMADSPDEVRQMFELAEEKGLVLLEAVHYRFHPAAQRAKAIIESGELGAVTSMEVTFQLPGGFIREGDIRYSFKLGGGAMMDPGCYPISIMRFLIGAEPTAVLAASHEPPFFPVDAKIDQRVTAALSFPNDITASLNVNLSRGFYCGVIPRPPNIRAIIKCMEGELELTNFIFPSVYHNIYVRPKGKAARTEKAYTFRDCGVDAKGEDWWTTFRYQLEAFVDHLKGRTPQAWVSKDDSIANMQWVENVYVKGGYGPRQRSEFKFTA